MAHHLHRVSRSCSHYHCKILNAFCLQGEHGILTYLQGENIFYRKCLANKYQQANCTAISWLMYTSYFSFIARYSIGPPHQSQPSRLDPFPLQNWHSVLPPLVVCLFRALRPAHSLHCLLFSFCAVECTSRNFKKYRHASRHAFFEC